jgi:hypothetical protein
MKQSQILACLLLIVSYGAGVCSEGHRARFWDAQGMIQRNKQFCQTQISENANFRSGVAKICQVFSHGRQGIVSQAQSGLENPLGGALAGA